MAGVIFAVGYTWTFRRTENTELGSRAFSVAGPRARLVCSSTHKKLQLLKWICAVLKGSLCSSEMT